MSNKKVEELTVIVDKSLRERIIEAKTWIDRAEIHLKADKQLECVNAMVQVGYVMAFTEQQMELVNIVALKESVN